MLSIARFVKKNESSYYMSTNALMHEPIMSFMFLMFVIIAKQCFLTNPVVPERLEVITPQTIYLQRFFSVKFLLIE
jgi:hypothetical protein